MGCSSCKQNKGNTIDGLGDSNTYKFNYFSRIMTFTIGLILAPIILIGVYFLMVKHILIRGEMTISFDDMLKYYTDWKKSKQDEKEDLSDEEFENVDPDEYELITKVDKIN